ncbi:DUF397 domain-containing protein (plasmid) [Embleya sp. NBC_00888]|uniref:DUF397 domain-containing protein n=1 Tax=Embleya sp. NBC_00888 TaxID=2975960 RepID=UPI002F9083FA|nr:DUF397 domain-containing protein [Embleya sp. NBC_00888]
MSSYAWRKTRRSATSNCVECQLQPDHHHVKVRDSKCPHRAPQLTFADPSWNAFVSRVQPR